ncbi:hypothetical protein J7I93_23135 [Bacillus sp. ISL-47]|uniref:hypothetical protein n=1 Tax=Bacillus sp. ISL-47 TaxID=2819130 RepID=UPI001BE4E8ED|nr:hypothetical protein [Bacillus sp. ISL-47]MBT2691033.1 hypothetical protein [Bacillus sp. ISL-47]MBT2710872.1 hypothetical protein [Pseudomonas sp. ISL-84]
MNIQQYYRKTADISLNGSLAALVPPSFFLIYAIIAVPRTNLFLIVTPFIIYSFFCYQTYLLNKQRAEEVVERSILSSGHYAQPLLSQSITLIAFMPAPSLRMVIFNSEGRRCGEIRDMNFWKIRWFLPYLFDRFFSKKLGIFNDDDTLVAMIIIKRNRVEILDCKGSAKETIFLKKEGSNLIYIHSSVKYYIPKPFFHTDLQVYKEDSNRIARFRKGWMPLEWGQRFKDPNTPVLTFEEGVAAEEKIRIYAIFACIFHYQNH